MTTDCEHHTVHTELYSLSKIFTENLYRIPDYQRGYSWTKRQIKDFWDDLVLLEPNRDHYTGVLTLEQVPKDDYQRWVDDMWIIESKRYCPYYVVDGQQRLTTSLILLQALIEQVPDEQTLNYSTIDEIRKKYIYESRDRGVSRSYIFGYEKDNPSYEYLKTKIFMEKSDNHEVGEQTIYTYNLINAKEYFGQRLKEMNVEKLEEIFTKLTQHFLFNIYTIAAGIEVFVAFETMNNRGKPLSHLELLKNRLIFLSTRLGADAIDREKVRQVVNEAWKTAYHYIGRNQKKPLDDDQFLWVHFCLYFGHSQYDDNNRELGWRRFLHLIRDGEYKNYLLDKIFTSRNVPRALEPDVKLNSEPVYAQHDELLTTEYLYEYARDLKNCVQVYYKIINPDDSDLPEAQKIWLARINRLGWYNAQALCLMASLSSKQTDVPELFSELERYLFLRHFLPYTAPLEGMDLLEMAVRLKKKLINIKEVASKLKEIADKYAEGFTTTDILSNPLSHRGYYGWRGIRYFLFEYEQELKRKSRSSRDKLTWDEFTSEHWETDYQTVEHVYPQKPTSEYWRSRFGHYSNRQKHQLRNSLGNLVALSRPKNASLGNRSFPEKIKGSDEVSGYDSGSYSEIQVSKYEHWTAQTILDRGILMLKFMEKQWRFKLKDESARVRALGLGFLLETSDNAVKSEKTSAKKTGKK